MAEKLTGPVPAPDDGSPENPERRRLLGGATVAAAALALGAGETVAAAAAPAAARAAAVSDAALREHIRHVVVLFAENRSFNNLFGDFPGLQQPLAKVPVEALRQRDRDGSVLATLPPIWGGMVPHAQIVEHRRFHIQEGDIKSLPNGPFALRTPDGDPLPQGVITRNLVHKFYENQLQINGGRNDGFVAWGDSGAFPMGWYADSKVNLRLWQLARQFTLCDNFFMGAFGGSFLNHQYLACAQPPHYANADKSISRFQIVQLEGDDPTGIRPRLAPDAPRSAMQGHAKFATPDTMTPDFWVVNTMGPAYAPAFSTDPKNPLLADPASPNTLPPQSHQTIGDALDEARVDWAWYGGGWQAALDGKGDGGPDAFPKVPNFQAHHQPFNYFRQYGPGTAARKQHLRDGGVGETSRTNHFLAAVESGTLPPVTFYKPQGDLNMHAGYADVDSGDRHLARVVDALRSSPQWPNMLVVVTVDENGGWWDHVAPPKGDRWGPGTRIPALVISPFARKGYVDHTIYDTGSILRFITRRFSLKKLAGLRMREEAMVAAGGPAPGDLTAALDLG
ncbi:MAG: acid phosphatase [Xanthomonadales bacterium]|nr:acid phosphatase [Xanthomonadales bacterium]